MSSVKEAKQAEWAYLSGSNADELSAQSTEHILKSRLGVKRTGKFQLTESMKAWIALIPAMFFLIVFMVYPIINSFLISFINNFYFVGGSGSSFAISNFLKSLESTRASVKQSWGFANYAAVLTDSEFLKSLGNTALIVVVSVPLTILIALVIAVLLNSIKPLRGFFQTVFFLPYVTNTIALGMVFRVIFSSNAGGLFNSFLGLFGIDAMHWLTAYADRWNMFFVIVVYAIWNGLAFKILVFQSGLASIDKQYYDAAKIDGANRTTIFRRVTVPLLSPEILYITITSFIGAFKSYSQIISLFGAGAYGFGGANNKEWETVVGYIYVTMQDTTKVGRAAAGSFVLLGIILLITLVQMVVSKRRVHY